MYLGNCCFYINRHEELKLLRKEFFKTKLMRNFLICID